MLQDPNVERYVTERLQPLQKQIKELQAEVFRLMQAKNLHLQNVMRNTLEQKEAAYKEICAWFENEYSPAFTDEDEVVEWNKKATEVNAQIKLLRFLLSEYCA